MDMRGCAATPRRPSGHLQKQNGYHASWYCREMATEPYPSACDFISCDGLEENDLSLSLSLARIGRSFSERISSFFPAYYTRSDGLANEPCRVHK